MYMTAFRKMLTAAIIASGLFWSPAAPAADDDALYRSFATPPAEYRGKPFWSLNGNLDKGELIRQIHTLKKMGFGGFFMPVVALRGVPVAESLFQKRHPHFLNAPDGLERGGSPRLALDHLGEEDQPHANDFALLGQACD